MTLRLHKTALFTLFLAIFAGCVPSWNPLYTEKDLVFDPQLVGTWKGDDGETWQFEKNGDKKYRLVFADREGKATFIAHLMKINDRQFLDLYLHESAAEDMKINALARLTLMPVHLFLRVDQIGESLKMAVGNPEWLDNHLKANPKAIAHRRQSKRIVLTAETKDLQDFVMKHAEGEALFADPFTVKRVPTK
jgi:hypothetical protein